MSLFFRRRFRTVKRFSYWFSTEPLTTPIQGRRDQDGCREETRDPSTPDVTRSLRGDGRPKTIETGF